MALPLLALAAKLLPFASAIPDVLRAFGGDRKADAAEKMVSVAKALTGHTDSEQAVDAIAKDPALQFQYQQMLSSERLKFKEMEYVDAQTGHHEQQETIRGGDRAEDPYVRHTRPKIARQSWYGTLSYVFVFEFAKVLGKVTDGANVEIALVLLAPAAAYLGFRTGDKFAKAWKDRKSQNREVQ